MIGIGNYIGKSSGIQWSSYWETHSPTGLTLKRVSDTEGQLDWTNNSTIADGTKIEYTDTPGGGSGWAELATVAYPTSTYVDNTFTNGVIRYYRIRAYKSTNYSEYTSTVNITANGVTINSANTVITLADPSNNFYFNNGSGSDLPFTVIMVAKSNTYLVQNIALSRGNASGNSWYVGLDQATGYMDIALYGSDLTGNNILYSVASPVINECVNRYVWTYDGSKSQNGLKIYKNGIALTLTANKYGTYTNMNNRAGVQIGKLMTPSTQGNLDLYLLMICNIALNQTQVNELETMADGGGIAGLSFYANLMTINQFNGNLNDDLGVHNGTAVAPVYKYHEDFVLNSRNIKPSTSTTAFQTTFNAFKLGWFICYNMESYTGEEITVPYPPATPATFAAPANVNVQAWATLAASYSKIDYAILTTNSINGFNLHPFTAKWRGSRLDIGGGKMLPYYTQYDTGVTNSDKAIVTKFISEFNAVNIKPILYYLVSPLSNWGGNVTGGFMKDHYTTASYQFYYYHLYTKECLQELAALSPFAIWIDLPVYYPPLYLAELYFAIKRISSSIGVIMNVANSTVKVNSPFFPMDAASKEEVFQPALPSDTWWGKTHTYGVPTFPISKELAFTSREDGGTYYWYYAPTPKPLRTLVALQAEYDYAKAAAVPCCVSINPKLDGVIDQDQADLIGDIVL